MPDRYRRRALLLLLAVTLPACTTQAPVSTPAGTTFVPDSDLQRVEVVTATLPSGFRVIVASVPPIEGQEPRAFVGSYILHGTYSETRLGWAHLMEHVAANNRSTVAAPPRPEGVSLLEANALARPYYTSFVAVAPPPLVPLLVHGRLARAGRTANDPQIFAREIERVVAELERDAGGSFPAFKALIALSLGRPPRLDDEIASVRAADRDAVAAEMALFYRPGNALLVVTGNVEPSAVLAMIREAEARLALTELPPAATPAKAPALLTGQSGVLDGQNRSGRTLVGLAWPKPGLDHPDVLPLLVADQLMLGRGDDIIDPVRSDASPIAGLLGGSQYWDGRAGRWGPPELVDTDAGLHAVIFSTDRDMTVGQVRSSVDIALRQIRAAEMSDARILAARESLARFLARWLLEPNYRILADHLMAFAAVGRNPEEVKRLPDEIRRVRPAAVRDAFDRYFLRVAPNVVVLPSAASGN